MAQLTPKALVRRPTGSVGGAVIKTDMPAAGRIAYKALADGGERRGKATFYKDAARFCDAPVRITWAGRPRPDQRPGTSIFVDYDVPCRKCAGCLRARSREWTARAIAEMRVASRTWFVTFTFEPEIHATLLMAARYRSRGWEHLSEGQRFHAHHLECARLVTLWLKRVRKGEAKLGEKPVRFRYMFVVEAHKSGLPHYHMLLHEQGVEISKRRIQREWNAGFTTAKLADKSRAYYVSKYLAKTAECRVRASLRYGSGQ